VKDLSSPIGPQGTQHRRDRDAGPDGLRKEYGKSQPLKGAKIAGCLHMTIQTAALIETLTRSAPKCAGHPATSSRPRTTRRGDRRDRRSGLRLEGETEEEYWWCVEQTIQVERLDAEHDPG